MNDARDNLVTGGNYVKPNVLCLQAGIIFTLKLQRKIRHSSSNDC